ncbi:MAG: hypothetical protein ACJ79H_03100 [Myxococcales bacterium]
MRFARVVAAVLCLAAGAAWADAQQAQPRGRQAQARSDAKESVSIEKRETRTLQLGGGSYIRYEVMPGDDEQPPGELVVMHMEAPPAAPQAAQASSDDQPESRARAAVRSYQRRRAACDDARMRLAARLLELRGVQVDPDVALWVTRNLYFAGDGVPAVQVFADPLFFSAMQSDSTARSLAVELAHCEDAARR